MKDSGPPEMVATIRSWVEKAVIGLKLCPFAAPVYRKGQLRIVISEASVPEETLTEVLREVNLILREDPENLATTLVVFPHTLKDFNVFLDTLGTLRFVLSDVGADGILQIASFHPDYHFADADPDDVSNYTNRSPWPIYHILREDDVSHAVDTHPDAESIPDANIETMEKLGREGVGEIWNEFMPARGQDPDGDKEKE